MNDDLCQSDQHLDFIFLLNTEGIKSQLFTVEKNTHTKQMCSTPNSLQQRNIYFLKLSVQIVTFHDCKNVCHFCKGILHNQII